MRILIAYEKHGNRYFDASDNEKLHKACIKLLKERLEEGWYNNQTDNDEAEPVEKILGFTKAQIDEMPEGEIKEEALEKYKYALRQNQWETEEIEFRKRVKALLKNKNVEIPPMENSKIPAIGKLNFPALKARAVAVESWSLLRSRREHEYEKVELEELEGA